MAKFIEITDHSGEWFLVNVRTILYLHIKPSRAYSQEKLYQIEVPGRMIEVTEEMFNKVKKELQEL